MKKLILIIVAFACFVTFTGCKNTSIAHNMIAKSEGFQTNVGYNPNSYTIDFGFRWGVIWTFLVRENVEIDTSKGTFTIDGKTEAIPQVISENGFAIRVGWQYGVEMLRELKDNPDAQTEFVRGMFKNQRKDKLIAIQESIPSDRDKYFPLPLIE